MLARKPLCVGPGCHRHCLERFLILKIATFGHQNAFYIAFQGHRRDHHKIAGTILEKEGIFALEHRAIGSM